MANNNTPLPHQKHPNNQGQVADLIRRKIESIHNQEPDILSEAPSVKELGRQIGMSQHQKFIRDLVTSGKSVVQIQTEWHEYYASLNDADKHQVWQEYHEAQATSQAMHHSKPYIWPAAVESRAIHKQPLKPLTARQRRFSLLGSFQDLGRGSRSLSAKKRLHSLLFGLSIGTLVLLIFMFSFFNERLIAPFVTPSKNVSSTPIISDSTIASSSNPTLIIPKINVEVPVVYTQNSVDEGAVQKSLEDGVVHYANTPLPGQNGNGVIVGHSSNNIFNHGKYKFAFVLLSRMEAGDTFMLDKDGKQFTYRVYEKRIVKPDQVEVLSQQPKPATFSLITCDPPGTSINRLVVVGEQVSPDIAQNSNPTATAKPAFGVNKLPGNAPSLWSRLMHSF